MDLLIEKIKNNIPFSFTRWGDGEWIALSGGKGKNCDKHEYFSDMGKNLKDILNSNPPYYMGLQPLAQNIMSRIILKYNHINWIDSDIFHDASINGDFNKFFSACDGKNIILVAPDYMIGLNKFIKTITKHIIIPSVNCWLSKDKILKKINEYLKGRNVKHIILFSSKMIICSSAPAGIRTSLLIRKK